MVPQKVFECSLTSRDLSITHNKEMITTYLLYGRESPCPRCFLLYPRQKLDGFVQLRFEDIQALIYVHRVRITQGEFALHVHVKLKIRSLDHIGGENKRLTVSNSWTALRRSASKPRNELNFAIACKALEVL